MGRSGKWGRRGFERKYLHSNVKLIIKILIKCMDLSIFSKYFLYISIFSAVKMITDSK